MGKPGKNVIQLDLGNHKTVRVYYLIINNQNSFFVLFWLFASLQILDRLQVNKKVYLHRLSLDQVSTSLVKEKATLPFISRLKYLKTLLPDVSYVTENRFNNTLENKVIRHAHKQTLATVHVFLSGKEY